MNYPEATVPSKQLVLGGRLRKSDVLLSLTKATSDSSYNHLRLKDLNIDMELALAIAKLLRSRESCWKTFHLRACKGQLEPIIAIAMACPIESFTFSLDLRLLHPDSWFYGFEKISAANKNLKELHFCVTINEANARPLGYCLENCCTNLQFLDLNGCDFDGDSFRNVVAGLKRNKTLQKIDMGRCLLYDWQMSELATIINNHPTLQDLLLQENNGDGMTAISSLLSSSTTNKIRHLNLDFQWCYGDDMDITDTTQETNVQRQPIDISYLANTLQTNASLESLHLCGNRLTDVDLQTLIDALQVNNILHTLVLQCNKFSDEGICSMSKTLTNLKGLKRLYLKSNPFGSMGAHALLKAIKFNTELYVLDFFRPTTTGVMSLLQKEVHFYGQLNRSGRRLLYKCHTVVPVSLWPHILEQAATKNVPPNAVTKNNSASSADILLYFLTNGPILFPF